MGLKRKRESANDFSLASAGPKPVTVCGNVDQACPVFSGQVNRYHWGFYDSARA